MFMCGRSSGQSFFGLKTTTAQGWLCYFCVEEASRKLCKDLIHPSIESSFTKNWSRMLEHWSQGRQDKLGTRGRKSLLKNTGWHKRKVITQRVSKMTISKEDSVKIKQEINQTTETQTPKIFPFLSTDWEKAPTHSQPSPYLVSKSSLLIHNL